MSNESKTQQAFLEAIDIMINNKLKNLGYNYYVDGVIKDINNENNTYEVLINDNRYKDIPVINNMEYKVNDVVQILIKNGNWSKKYIISKIKSDGNSSNFKDIVANNLNVTNQITSKTLNVTDEIKTKDLELTNFNTCILQKVYPVGSIYISVSSTNPSTLFGGTWEQLKDRFLLSAGDTYTSGNTGGEATHKLTVSEMPKHAHTTITHKNGFGDTNVSSTYTPTSAINSLEYGNWGTTDLRRISGVMFSEGSDSAHNNMPPYLVVYMWKRIG